MRKYVSLMLLTCALFMTEFRGEADYIVYLTDFRGEDTAKGMFKDCRFTQFRGQAWKIYLTRFRGEADLIVYRHEFATR